MTFKHHDEARRDCIKSLAAILNQAGTETRAVLIDDLYGKLRLVLWPGTTNGASLTEIIQSRLAAEAGDIWSKQIWLAPGQTTQADGLVYERVWDDGKPCQDQPRLRIADRHRGRTAWFKNLSAPPWPPRHVKGGGQPPIVVFYSFKGGVGRTTALASFAIQRARAGERVVVIDGDLDAPGVGTLLSPDEPAASARWGVADYLLERPAVKAVDLSDYYHALRRESLGLSQGEILVFPVGRLDEEYLSKVARLDFEPSAEGLPLPWPQFLGHIRQDLSPDWVLIDSRGGLGETAGLFLSGVAHLHALFGTATKQSWQGLRLILDRLGAERVRQGQRQAECLLIQAMIPEDPAAAKMVKEQFMQQAEDEFEESYYAADPADETDDSMWFVRDAASKDAPHRPIPISYRQPLAHFEVVDEVLSVLLSDEYQAFAQHICDRFLEDRE